MITIIVLAITVIALILSVIFHLKDGIYSCSSLAFGIVAGGAGLIAFILCFITVTNAISDDSMRIGKMEEYNMLTYELENLEEDIPEIEKVYLMEKICNYNKDVSKTKIQRKNIWICNLIPKCYEDLPLIDYEEQLKN